MYLGLTIALFVLTFMFFIELWKLLAEVFHHSSIGIIIMTVLELIDVVLIANLVLMIIFSGYENFVSRIEAADGHEDKPAWMGGLDYGNLKLKVMGSIVAISVIQLLRVFLEADKVSEKLIIWMIVLHLVFVVSGLLFALTELVQKHAEKLEKLIEHSEHK